MGPSVNVESHINRRCHQALGEGGAAVGFQSIMHKPVGGIMWCLSPSLCREGTGGTIQTLSARSSGGVQASLMKMNKRGDLPFMAAAFVTYIFMGWRDSS